MEEPLEIPIMNDLTMVLGSISQVLQPYVGEKMCFTPLPQYLCMIAFAIGSGLVLYKEKMARERVDLQISLENQKLKA